MKIELGNQPFPFHIDIADSRRVTITKLESSVLVTIETENKLECYQLVPVGNSEDEYGLGVRIQNMETFPEWFKRTAEQLNK